jgi:hypothetical protein
VFKWICLAVAVLALGMFGWMLNDVRLEMKRLAAQAEERLPRILSQTERITTQLDSQLPRLMSQTEIAATNINRHLPPLMETSEKAATTLNKQLPQLLASTEAAADSISKLADEFGDYQAMMSLVHSADQDKSLFSYGSSILSFLEGTPATIGRKKSETDTTLKSPIPAKTWATNARRTLPALSVKGATKTDVLHNLARTHSAQPWYIQIGSDAPRLLGDWLKEKHPESRERK